MSLLILLVGFDAEHQRALFPDHSKHHRIGRRKKLSPAYFSRFDTPFRRGSIGNHQDVKAMKIKVKLSRCLLKCQFKHCDSTKVHLVERGLCAEKCTNENHDVRILRRWMIICFVQIYLCFTATGSAFAIVRCDGGSPEKSMKSLEAAK